MRKLLSWMLATITALMIFVLVIIPMPIQIKTAKKIELSYIFVDEKGIEYDIFEPVHGAATDWSFLFEDELGDIEVEQETNDLDIEDKIKEIEIAEKSEVDLEQLVKDIEEIKKDAEEKKEDTIDGSKKNEQKIEETIKLEAKSCTTPWNTVLGHGESVIAYEQRSDVASVCNAQRRVCNDGILNGNYTQGACKEDVEYNYTKLKVVSHNTKILGELIQNPKYAKNDGAEFDTDGKINPDKKEPISHWDNSIKDETVKNETINIGSKNHYNCNSPWGEVIKHGQFVKAYKSPLGFTDDPCQVELRLCLDGDLNGRYQHKVCEYSDISSQDFGEGNKDVTKPSKELLEDIQKEKSGGLWAWIIGLFK